MGGVYLKMDVWGGSPRVTSLYRSLSEQPPVFLGCVRLKWQHALSRTPGTESAFCKWQWRTADLHVLNI